MKLTYNSIWSMFVELSNHVIYYEFILFDALMYVKLVHFFGLNKLGAQNVWILLFY